MRLMARTGARRVAVGGVAGLLVAGGALLAVGTSTAGADTFNGDSCATPPCFGSPQTFTVPAGVCQVTIAAFGASGDGNGDTTFGGGGGRLQADFTVTPGEALTVIVGENGGDGGVGFNTGGTPNGDGFMGGGSSGVKAGATPLIVAGGGGGAGASSSEGGQGGVALTSGPTDPGSGQPGAGNTGTGGLGGTANGTPADGGAGGGTDGGGGGAGAAPGNGGSGGEGNGSGGGGGNFTSSTAGLTAPTGLNSRDGEVVITAAAPGVGCPPTPTTLVVTAPTAAFTG